MPVVAAAHSGSLASSAPPDRPLRALGAIGEGLVEVALADGARSVTLGCGGDAANVCVMAARLGAPVRLGGRVGRDALGRLLVSFWRANAIDTTAVRDDPTAPTGLYVNEPTEQGTHRFIYWRHASAGSRLEPTDITAPFFNGLAILVVTGVTLAVSRSSAAAARHAIARARAHGARIACVLNHRPALGGDVAELAEIGAGSDILFASVEDLSAIFDTSDPELLVRLLPDGPSEIVVTAGGEPARVINARKTYVQAVPPAPVRNAAGAGDALAGAYLAARLSGDGPARSLAWGVAAATLSVAGDGCAIGYPSRRETVELLHALPRGEELPGPLA